MSLNYYQILECDNFCDFSVVKSKYKLLTMKYHPDKNPDNKELYLLVQEAYRVLSTEKEEYDNLLRHNTNIIVSEEKRDKFDQLIDNTWKNEEFDFFDELEAEEIEKAFNESDRTELIRELNFYLNSPATIKKKIEESKKLNYQTLNKEQIIYKYTDKAKQPDLEIDLELPLKHMVEGCKYNLEYDIKRICPICNGNEKRKCRTCQDKRIISIKRRLIANIPPKTAINSTIRLKHLGNQTPYYTGVGDLVLKVTQKGMSGWYFKNDLMTFDITLSAEEMRKKPILHLPYFDKTMLKVATSGKFEKIIVPKKGWINKNNELDPLVVNIIKKRTGSKLYIFIPLFLLVLLGVILS